jgi:hypothetical protein
MMIAVPAAGAEGLFEQVNIGPVSIGGRATYYDPKDASGEWYGGAQVRLHAFRFLGLEGSADYRRKDFGNTRVHSYPVRKTGSASTPGAVYSSF